MADGGTPAGDGCPLGIEYWPMELAESTRRLLWAMALPDEAEPSWAPFVLALLVDALGSLCNFGRFPSVRC